MDGVIKDVKWIGEDEKRRNTAKGRRARKTRTDEREEPEGANEGKEQMKEWRREVKRTIEVKGSGCR